MEEIKQVIEIIHPNETLRTYAVTKALPRKDATGYADYGIRHTDMCHPDMAPLVAELLAKPYVKTLDISKTGIKVEATDAFEDMWDKFHDEIIRLVNFYIFDGEAQVRVRDDRPKYAAANAQAEAYGLLG